MGDIKADKAREFQLGLFIGISLGAVAAGFVGAILGVLAALGVNYLLPDPDPDSWRWLGFMTLGAILGYPVGVVAGFVLIGWRSVPLRTLLITLGAVGIGFGIAWCGMSVGLDAGIVGWMLPLFAPVFGAFAYVVSANANEKKNDEPANP